MSGYFTRSQVPLHCPFRTLPPRLKRRSQRGSFHNNLCAIRVLLTACARPSGQLPLDKSSAQAFWYNQSPLVELQSQPSATDVRKDGLMNSCGQRFLGL